MCTVIGILTSCKLLSTLSREHTSREHVRQARAHDEQVLSQMAAGDFELTSTVTAPEATEGVSSGLEVIMVGLWLSLGSGERAGFGACVAIESEVVRSGG